LKSSNKSQSNESWSLEDSLETYNIKKWGDKYFSLNKKGNVAIFPNGDSGNSIDLLQLMKELKSREINPPLILRFNDILKNRLSELNNAFEKAIKSYHYKNIYKGVFPIKCNHHKNLLEKILEFGDKWDFGLEVGSKSELLIGLSLIENRKSLLICNGYKDKSYIEMTILASKLGKKPVLVIEQRDEVPRIIECVKRLGAKPLIGIRSKLSSRSSGRWGESIGDSSKFGLSVPEIILTIKDLKEANLFLKYYIPKVIKQNNRKKLINKLRKIFIELLSNLKNIKIQMKSQTM